MENPADVTFWAFVTTVVIGTTTAAVGWLRRGGRSEPEQPALLHNAAIVDSSLVRDLLAQMVEQVIQTRKLAEQTWRLADTAEELLEVERGRDKRKAAERHDSEIETLRREIEDLKRERSKR